MALRSSVDIRLRISPGRKDAEQVQHDDRIWRKEVKLIAKHNS
ncbi:hypothetical protein SAMN05421827_11184 [Pedobacter terrae]|uniref:Uncharacterized protein n=1 Tax=Pedobacter terrae TaxID=405671 RepID=A0A1G7X6D7_9SPHI|nr:hypothetical protein SAMN05421827_11184 [Pedobacter terrae]